MAVRARFANFQFVSNYIGELRSRTGYYIGYVPESYADSVTDDSYYQCLMNDDAVNHAMNILSLQAAGEEIKIYHKNPVVAIILKRCIGHIQDYAHARKSLLEKGVLFGLGVQRKYYKDVKLTGLKGTWNLPYRIQEVDRRRLRIEREVGKPTESYWTLWVPLYDQYIILEDRSKVKNIEEGAGVQDYCWYISQWEELSPYFRGVGEVIYPLAYMKKKLLQYYGDLCESWATPFLTVILNTMKGAITSNMGGGFTTLADRVSTVITAMENAKSRHIAVLDEGDKLEYHEHGSTGQNLIQAFVDYIDKRIVLQLLGTELTTGASSHGSYAQADVHRGMGETVIAYRRHRLEEFNKIDILQDIIIRNSGNFVAMNLPTPNIADIEFTFESRKEKMREDAMVKRISSGRHDATKEI